MLKYADVEMDSLKPVCHLDVCPVVGNVRYLPYQDCERNISKQVK